ncbi:similar to Saccharomyces cerevisiae YDL183C Mitochondrial inner-membrane protein thought to be involved in the formation of an active mitochondrial K+/H+ exchanger (KHE) system [Maudiozyma saulgeensis]|uniref:Similar to Saccharomyces cerevisiae YDL183C Mitochondrial inner-membrane protein thought to be involved in the formation of an active mitochondrial K+/H+ exchanger (KHE) system n=1 Tax=Maudiozyma saulgeensis TaxID=1789683 RepID=A0A1X7R2Z6_9SACH|nr:similar to Saccharomyces cerevisiae YDL183C Mitochondrial inner-membrane protein thought to be involved in the formation of an active mitochondrial K+/H+ exchanger (KHE) system [Kazachstania saulgeensis]
MLTRRFAGNVANIATKGLSLERYLNDPLKLVIIPINKEKLFVYCKHHDSLQNKKSRIQTTEKWVVNKFTYLWLKLANSPKSYNQKIVKWVNKTIDKIPWPEASLLTIPGESYILKRLLHDENQSIQQSTPTHVTKNEYKNLIPKPRIQPINVYFPLTHAWKSDSILKELNEFSEIGIKNYKRRTLVYISLIPFTLPIALLPIVPNIPGFYLAYRSYCSYKAYIGAKHLKSLLDHETKFKGDNRIKLCELPDYTSLINNKADLNESTVDAVVELLDIKEIRNVLLKSVRQEVTKRS